MLYKLLIYWYLYFCLCERVHMATLFLVSIATAHHLTIKIHSVFPEINGSLFGYTVCFVFKITF